MTHQDTIDSMAPSSENLMLLMKDGTMREYALAAAFRRLEESVREVERRCSSFESLVENLFLRYAMSNQDRLKTMIESLLRLESVIQARTAAAVASTEPRSR